MVVDDHPMWRAGVARDLEEAGYEVVAAVGEGAQAVRVAAAVRPDVVVLDLQLPDLSGVEVIHGLLAAQRAETLQTRVLVLSASGEQRDVLDAVKAVFTAGLAGLVLGEFRRLATTPSTSDEPDAPRLTDRETEVLRLVAKGLSY